MRLSISAKIFVGFVVLLAAFGGVSIYGVVTMRRLADELRLVSQGYLELRLRVSEIQTGQGNLLKLLAERVEKADGAGRVPRFIKVAIDDARRTRLKNQVPQLLGRVKALGELPSSREEKALLAQLRGRIEGLERALRADEELFDRVYGPIGDAPLAPAEDGEEVRVAAEQLLRREQALRRDLNHLAADLQLRAQQAGLRLEESESRAVWAALLLTIAAVLIGFAVLVLVTRAVRPLRRLAERAREIARGDYKKRVDEASRDEIGALGREFNAMAAALDEREQQLIRSERLAAVGKIAAQITHEVRNPLSSIGLNAELLEDELAAIDQTGERSGEARALVRAIVKEVDRLAEITGEYLRFARLPKTRLEREDFAAIVTSVAVFLRPELEARRIELVLEVPPLPLVAADENQLRQALLNLMRNAADAMPNGGRLSVRVVAQGEQVVLTIADTGEGIRPEDLARIFDPFFSTKEGGTGLGLALTQQIVVEHGGRIDVRSTPGAGTVFTVTLPAAAPAPPASDEASPAGAEKLAPAGAGER